MHQFKQLSSTLKARIFCDFIFTVTSSAILPFMALYLTTMVNAVFAGTFLITTIIAGFFLAFLGGYISDHFERKKTISWIHLVLVIALAVMLLTINQHQLGLVLFCMAFFVYELLMSLESPVFEAAIMDAIPIDLRDYIFRLFYWISNVAMALGMLLGALLYEEHRHLLLGLLLVSTLLSWGAFIFFYDVQQKYAVHHDSLDSVVKKFAKGYLNVFKDKSYMMLMIGFAFVFMAEASLDSYVIVRLKETFVPVEILGIEISSVRIFTLIMIVNTITVVLLTFKVNAWVERYSKRGIFIAGIILYTAGYAWLTSSNDLLWILVFAFIATLGELVYSPIYNAERFKMTPEDQRGVYASVSGLSIRSANILARFGLILGAFLTPWMMSVFTGGVLLIGFIFMYIVLFQKQAAKQ